MTSPETGAAARATEQAETRVAVCVATLERPVGLDRLLASMAELVVPAGVRLRLVVADNDPDGSASVTVSRWRDRVPADVVHVVEPRRGIAYARNRAVVAAGPVDWCAFVDDDERVAPGWLDELLRVAADHDADVVTGTVLPEFVDPPPAWAVEGGFFERPRFATGTRIGYARTSNALVAAHVLPGAHPFDERLARSGGEDTHLFQRVRLAGGTIVWADDAVVVESVPATRVRPGWLLRREYRRGNTLSLCLRDLEDSRARRAKRVAAAAVHAGAGVLTVATSVRRGRVALLRGAQRCAFAAGLLTGLTGHVYEEYATLHGT